MKYRNTNLERKDESELEFLDRKFAGMYKAETSLLERMDDTLKDMRRHLQRYKKEASPEALNEYKINLLRLTEQTDFLQILYLSDRHG